VLSKRCDSQRWSSVVCWQRIIQTTAQCPASQVSFLFSGRQTSGYEQISGAVCWPRTRPACSSRQDTSQQGHITFYPHARWQIEQHSASVECVRANPATLARPPISSSLKMTDRSFRYALPCRWNQRFLSLCQPHSGTSSSFSDSPIPSPTTSSSFDSPFYSSITHSLSLFHSRFKPTFFTNPTPTIFTSSSRTAFTDFYLDRFFWANRFLFLIFPYFSFLCRAPYRQLLSARKYIYRSYRILSYRITIIANTFIQDGYGSGNTTKNKRVKM